MYTRRILCSEKRLHLQALLLFFMIGSILTNQSALKAEERPWIEIRGVYGGEPQLPTGKTLADYGVNAIWVGSGSVSAEQVERLHQQGVKLFVEFNTMHESSYLKDHQDAVPVGVNGMRCPAPDDWQGVCPTHPGYRAWRMLEFRKILEKAPIDGLWLDYHHAHASWEQAVQNMPETCFCDRCVDQFQKRSGITLKASHSKAGFISELLKNHRPEWVEWRCSVFTDWVREFRELIEKTRPNEKVLLGTFHCPWTTEDYNGAIRNLLAIDLKQQAKYIDVFSIMPYHARFGHVNDPAWISRQTTWLGNHLAVSGDKSDKNRIWPIVQLADWGEVVQPAQIPEIMDQGTRRPATGVTIFHSGGLNQNPERIEALGRFYRSIKPLKFK